MSVLPQAIAINGGPRKQWNTAMLLEKALEGAASVGAATSMVHLYDLNYKGCTSCFSCKRKDHYREGKCAMKDDLAPVLERIMAARVVFLGSPIYLGDVTGALRSLYERLLFINLAYDEENRFILETGPSVGLIYTMNVTESVMEELGYPYIFNGHVTYLKGLMGEVEYMTACDTCQFTDYAAYHAPRFDSAHKKKRREEQFPLDCERAFQMGARLMRAS